VVALRDQLEATRLEAERRQQAALRVAHDEIRQLKATITALRDELDAQRGVAPA
jgi:HAMP domain-containing protein